MKRAFATKNNSSAPASMQAEIEKMLQGGLVTSRRINLI
jgi:hypothetical protein